MVRMHTGVICPQPFDLYQVLRNDTLTLVRFVKMLF